MRERNRLESAMKAIRELESELADNTELAELAEADGDDDLMNEAVAALEKARERAAKAELEALLSGEADGNDAYLEIHPGAGGTEATDWAAMLQRMYTRWANASGYKVELIEEQAGDEAGIKSCTLLVKGENAYGWLKTEAGVHRLVRISPFDSSARRHTSFASVWSYPLVDDTIEIDIPESEVRTDTYRASGAGGQHVNKTDSAIRLTYTPPGESEPIVVQCQNDRSQHKNRAQAWNMLRARVSLTVSRSSPGLSWVWKTNCDAPSRAMKKQRRRGFSIAGLKRPVARYRCVAGCGRACCPPTLKSTAACFSSSNPGCRPFPNRRNHGDCREYTPWH